MGRNFAKYGYNSVFSTSQQVARLYKSGSKGQCNDYSRPYSISRINSHLICINKYMKKFDCQFLYTGFTKLALLLITNIME